MRFFTAKEMKNRLGQVLIAAACAPVEITKNGSMYA
jgi:hypothetical protein